ncbi:SDR family NAD(P)-dependent oxidoreductase [Sphingobacterium oryzagri]|uniref:SDR family NAD(P)-dependent oxidoreductase n=1 Tax=Sphingobacterium oryzagri TaxID=3025669 RepID=A0ABY7WBP4_9SPHI|nr:SDR family NAD(P)-dependent oxidoreductase [Sphingobacterium sp. KACC 22765]WDF67081.1 SDR family NAD(P)-dependent oxidoreductase [Sphingobacterium sp. KACC 22765]
MKSIVIIGAGEGVGKETALTYGLQGYSVGIIRRDREALEIMLNELASQNIRAHGIVADVQNINQLAAAINDMYKILGRLDILLYNVPGPLREAYGSILDADVALLHKFLDLRIVNALWSIKTALPFLKESNGAIIITSGPSDRIAYPSTAIIGIAQAGLRMLAMHLAQELKSYDIYVGYVPLSNPPEYTDKAKDTNRSDVPAGFQLDNRVQASQVAQLIYKMTALRNQAELVVEAGTEL